MSAITSYSSISDLISAGIITPPVTVVGEYSGRLISAVIEQDGTFTHAGSNHNSPSVAAGKAITKETKTRTPGRQYRSVNGWKFWHLELGKKTKISLFEIRQKAIADQAGSMNLE